MHKKNWLLPIFAYTIFGVKELNFCVRDGNRCILFAFITNNIIVLQIYYIFNTFLYFINKKARNILIQKNAKKN